MRFGRRRRLYVDDLPPTHDARFLGLFLLSFVLALGAVYAVGYLVVGDKVPAGTTVAGAKIGGLSQRAAGTIIERTLNRVLDRPITASAAGHRVSFTPRAAGVSIDVPATLDMAMDGSQWNPRHMLAVLEGGGSVDPVFHVDAARLRSALAPLAKAVAASPVNSTVSIAGGEPVVEAGHPGQQLDLSVAPYLLSQALRSDHRDVALSLVIAPAAVDAAAASDFAETTVKRALTGPVTILVAGRPVKVGPALFGPALRVVESDAGLRLDIARNVLLDRTRRLMHAMPGRPQNARIGFGDGRSFVVPGQPGRVVDPASWARAVLAAVSAPDRRSPARSKTQEPAFTTVDARALHLVSPIGSASGAAQPLFPAAFGRAAAALNGKVVLPGAEFSYRSTVGPAGSFTVVSALEAAVETGADRAGLTVTRRPVPGAAGQDLVFRNRSSFPVYLRCWLIPRPRGVQGVYVQFWGTPSRR